jgi:phosphonopyruvate decarboxylase
MLICLPDKVLIKWLGNKEYISCSDEGEAIGIGAGYYVATGKRATVAISADGFCNALNPITSLVIPDGIKINIVISTGRQELQHKVMSDILEGLIKLLPYDPKRVNFKIIKK